MKERIQKLLASAGVDSRRNIEQMILQGRITVNGKTPRKIPVMVDPEMDKVVVDGQLIRLKARVEQRRFYVLLNKPKGVYSTNVAQGMQTRAIDLLPPGLIKKARLYPVGRLDAETKGLLLLTNDGELTNRLTHPKFGVPKTYRVMIDGPVAPPTIQQLEQGIWLADKAGKGFKTSPAKIRVAHRTPMQTILEVTLREGRDLPLGRMLAKFGHKVREIIRIKFGPLVLENLPIGESRPLTPKELRLLQKLIPSSSGETPPSTSS